MNQRVVYMKDDSLGTVAFKAIAENIKALRPAPAHLARLAKIASVFDHRTGIAVLVETTESHWSRNEPLRRLELFKKPQFFIDAAKALYDEILIEAREKERIEHEKREARRAKYKW